LSARRKIIRPTGLRISLFSIREESMRQRTLAIGAAAVAIALLSTQAVEAQQRFPLAPQNQRGVTVSPFFEGWYANPDGTYTLSFGYFNRNLSETVDIPIGPDNRIEPAEFDGMQPTSFPPVNYGGFNARRERGVFTITVPAEYRDRDIVWTLRVQGEELRVPGRMTSPAYELGYVPMAMGSMPPIVRFSPTGAAGQGPRGVTADAVLNARVGTPLPLTIYAQDTGEREERYPVNVTWQKHQGPGTVEFSPRTARIELGASEAATTATFSEPGEYLLRARVDNFTAPDSTFADQCCWTNGYVRVNVTN
jgi:hypothetical protein